MDKDDKNLNKVVVGRFAPSPTGVSHAGNIYAYLIAWLIANSQNGEIVCRIEDLDSSRSKQEYTESFLSMLDELGLTYDRGPFYQSNNKDSYEKAFKILDEKGVVYPCFCTRRDLAFQSAPHETDDTHVYDRRCLSLSPYEIDSKTLKLYKEGRYPSFRLKTDSRNISFDDLIYGNQVCTLDKECGDFVVKRADREFAYNLAVVIDDIDEGVNLVSRGRDLLKSTPQQIYLYHLLDERPPEYAHFPLICAKDGRRLAKRDKDATYDNLKALYGSPEGVLGHIAYLGGLLDKDEPTTPSILLDSFDIDSLQDLYGDRQSIIFE